MTMSVTFSIVVPLLLTAAVFALPSLRRWLDSSVARAKERTTMVEEFHSEAMSFMKSTDSVADAEIRRIVLLMSEFMMDGSKLVRRVIFANNGLLVQSNLKDRKASRAEMMLDNLSEETRHSFGKICALALIISSTQAVILGGFYQSAISLALRGKDKEVCEPEQIVYRFQKMGYLDLAAVPSRMVT